ncbi:hypothetical protein SynPROSU1_01189 [Synechococcus sp. PROS-U-1]|nr:hypothetical protein SynPROSU1_01189 [Synechococcus sp. PROS-U-1]
MSNAVSFELRKSGHHVCGSYLVRLASVLHPSLYQLLYKLLSGVHCGALSCTDPLLSRSSSAYSFSDDGTQEPRDLVLDSKTPAPDIAPG